MHAHGKDVGAPTNWISPAEAKGREPAVRVGGGVLESPGTGIVNSHALLTFLHGAFEDLGGDVALASSVSSVVPLASGGMGYRISATGPPGSQGDSTEITADVVVNAAGLGAIAISNMVLPQERHMKAYFCKGTYFSYSSSQPKVNTLLYPAPVKGLAGLGTHLTLDMAGRVRFGPDIEWIDDPGDYAPNERSMVAAVAAIKEYLPGLDEAALAPDYCGIRPKIVPEGGGGAGEVDFVIREEHGFDGFINLLGIESPGMLPN